MTKSELIEIIAREQSHLAYRDVELAVKCMIEQMSQSLASGDSVSLTGKYVPHFKPGKELRERVNLKFAASNQDEAELLPESVEDSA